MKLLGIDWGEKRIGLAVSDGNFARPYGVVDSFEKVKEVLKNEGIEQVVLGLPEGKNEKRVKTLAKLIESWGVPVIFRSEILTTQGALAKAIESGKSQKARRELDSFSAAILLQEYLDNLS